MDRARFPREKLCGDTLNPGALSLLERLGVDAVRPRALPISGMTVTGPGGARVTADYPDGLRGAAITRRDLDLLLVEAATRAGSRFEAGALVRGPLADPGTAPRLTGRSGRAAAGDREVRARVVIAAEGRYSRLAFGLGLARFAAAPKRWAFGAYFLGVEGTTSRGEMHIRPDGYIGIAPLAGGVANVCVVKDLKNMFRAQRVNVDRIVASAVNGDLMLRDRFVRARQVSEVTSLGPLAVDGVTAGYPGLLLAGDAAGFIDPMTGDGLRFAVRGGELAAEAALEELSSGAPACESLWQARAREFGPKWRINRGLRTLVNSPRAVGAAARSPSSGARRSACSFAWRVTCISSQMLRPNVILSSRGACRSAGDDAWRADPVAFQRADAPRARCDRAGRRRLPGARMGVPDDVRRHGA